MSAPARVEHRLTLSGSGRSFPRCERHWQRRLAFEDQPRALPAASARRVEPAFNDREAWDEDDY